MVLGFNKQFVEPINLCSKIHTIREDKNNRWKKGNSIQFATGVRTKNYKQFATGICVSTQQIEFKWGYGKASVMIYVDGRFLNYDEVEVLAGNDGFSGWKEFTQWEAWNKKDFRGKIIHWTDKKY